MAALEIPCPQCGKRLKVPDRRLLGRKGKCARCRHKFIMQEPDVPEESKPLTWTRGKTTTTQIEFAELPEFATLEEQTAAAHETPGSEPARRAEKASSPAVESAMDDPDELPDPADAFAVLELAAADPDSGFRRTAYRQGTSGRRTVMAVCGTLLTLAFGAAAWWVAAGSPGKSDSADQVAADSSSKEGAASAEQAPSDEPAAPAKPVRGQPIPLNLVPMGARIVIHLRPADLWQPGSGGEEFRACLGPLGVWLEQQVKTQCLLEPEQIESALFALIPVSREEFDVAVVVRARKPPRKSDLIARFDGELQDEPRPHYLGKNKAYLIHDPQTFAIAPHELAESLLESVEIGGVTSEGIEALLSRTDRNRHFTLLAELEDVTTGFKSLAPNKTEHLLRGVLDFFGEDVETVAWSLHLGDADEGRELFTEVLVRNRGSRSPAHLEKDLRKQLAEVPESVLRLARQSSPRQVGEGKIVGRFPILTKVVEQSAQFETGQRLVAIRWELPERAGPNLALGALLTWNQTTLPDFGRATTSPPAPTGPGGLPATIAERLQKKIDVEFRDDFLYVAINYIGDEIGVQFKLDGTGMKRAGVTQNEKQKFAMQNAPAGGILHRMLISRKLVLIVDEQQNVATITGAEEAEDRKLAVFPLQPAP